MSTGKPYIPIDRVLERVYDDYGLPQVYRSQAIEWAVDTMLLISPTDLLVDRKADIYVEHGRGRLPRGFESIKPGGLREKTSKKTLVEQTGAFSKEHKLSNGWSIYTTEGSSVVVAYDADGNLVDEDDLVDAQLPTSIMSVIRSSAPHSGYEYLLKDGWVFCGLDRVVLEISYKSLNVDFKTGEPLIPDDVKVINALVANIAYKIATRMFLRGQIQQYAYQTIEQEYLFNVASARSGTKILSPDRMESLKRRYLSLMPRTEEHRTGFSTSNQ